MVFNHMMRGARNVGHRVRSFGTANNIARVFSSAHNTARQFGTLARQGSHYGQYINNNILGGALNNHPVYENGMQLLTTLGKLS